MNGPEGLSPREREVLLWAARGQTAPQTAQTMNLACATVRTHRCAACRKLGARTITEAVAIMLIHDFDLEQMALIRQFRDRGVA